MSESTGGARMAPFHCPYCGEENLFPREGGSKEAGAAWECRSCARVFALKFLGLAREAGAELS